MNSTEDHETTEINAKDETATASEHNHAANGSVEASPGGDTNEWERWGRQLTQDMIERSLKDQRRSSVLRWIVRGVLLVYLGVVLILMSTCNGMGTHPDVLSKNSTHVAVIEIRGEISEGGPVDAEWVIPSLREAFKNKNSRAIVLSINSPVEVRYKAVTSMMKLSVYGSSIRIKNFMQLLPNNAPPGGIISPPLRMRFTPTVPV